MAYFVNKSFEPEIKVIASNEQWVTWQLNMIDITQPSLQPSCCTLHGNVAAEPHGCGRCLGGWRAQHYQVYCWGGDVISVCKTFKLKLDLAVTEFIRVDASHLEYHNTLYF